MADYKFTEIELQPDNNTFTEKEIIKPDHKRKEGAGWMGRIIPESMKPAEVKYDASTSPFLSSSIPDPVTGKMTLISYRNSDNEIEYLHNMTETFGREEIKHRENVRDRTGEHFYFVESDVNRYGDFAERNAIPYAHSTIDNKIRRRSNLQSAIVGTFHYDQFPSIIHKDFWRGDFKPKWRERTSLADPAFWIRSGGQTVLLGDIFGGAVSHGVRSLADADAERLEASHENSNGYNDLYHFHEPTRKEVQDWFYRPEGDAMDQWGSLFLGGLGTTGVMASTLRTVTKGRRIYYNAAKKTLRKMEEQGLAPHRVRTGVAGKGRVVERKFKTIKKPTVADLNKAKTNAERTKIVEKYKLATAERNAFKKQLHERIRNEYAEQIEKEVGRKLYGTRSVRKLYKKNQLEAALNPYKWAAEIGLAEVGLSGAMVLSNKYLSSDPNDNYALFGPMNMVIGIVGAMSSANLYSLGTAIGYYGKQAAKAYSVSGREGTGFIEAFRKVDMDVDSGEGVMDALEAIVRTDDPNFSIDDFLRPFPKAQKKRLGKLVKGIAESPADYRDEMLGEIMTSAQVLDELRRAYPDATEGLKKIELSLGQLANSRFIMASGEKIIGSDRAAQTVSLNLANKEAIIRSRNVQNLRYLEDFLDDMDSYGSGTQLSQEARNFIKGVSTVVDNIKFQHGPSMMQRIDDVIEDSIEQQLVVSTLKTEDPRRIERWKETKSIYLDYVSSALDETKTAAAWKKIDEFNQIHGAEMANERLLKIKELAGDGTGQPFKMGAFEKEFADGYWELGARIRSDGSFGYEVVKPKLKHLAFTSNPDKSGMTSDKFILEIADALKYDVSDAIVRRTVRELQTSINTSLQVNMHRAFTEFKAGLTPDQIKAIDNLIKNDGLFEATKKIVRAKENNRSVGSISADTVDDFELEIDILNQYDVQRAVNGLFARHKNDKNTLDRLKKSKISQFKTTHDNLIKKFEDAELDGGTRKSIKEFAKAKENYKTKVIPATTNNRIWNMLNSLRETDVGQPTYGKEAFKILRNDFLENPDYFMEEATRMFGKYDPKGDKFVLDLTTKDGGYLDKTIRTFIDNIVADEAERVAKTTRLEPIEPGKWKELVLPPVEEIDFENLKFNDPIFGRGFSSEFTNKLKNIENALDGTGIDVNNAIKSSRDYDRIIAENLEAQVAHKAFIKEMDITRKKLAVDTVELKSSLQRIITSADDLRKGGLAETGDFVSNYVIRNPHLLDDMKLALVNTGKMSEKEFGNGIRTLTATGLRRLSEIPAIESAAKPRTLRQRAEYPFVLKRQGPAAREFEKQHDAFLKEVDLPKKDTQSTNLDLTTRREVSGDRLLEILTENEESITKAFSYGTNENMVPHINNMRIVAKTLSILQRNAQGVSGADLLKASKTTIGGMASRGYAVFSGRVSWRYVGIEALYLYMARNEAAALAEILADPRAAKAIAYMAVYGQPLINTIRTTDNVSAWLPEVAMKSTEFYYEWLDNEYAKSGGTPTEFQQKLEEQMKELGTGSRKYGIDINEQMQSLER